MDLTWYQWLCLFSVPTLTGLLVTYVFNLVARHLEKKHSRSVQEVDDERREFVSHISSEVAQKLLDDERNGMKKLVADSTQRTIDTISKDTEPMKKGLQALLRNQLYELSDTWIPKGYAPIDVKNNFENIYQQYHSLGKNGVMTHIHDEFMNLPSVPEEPDEKKN